MKQLVQIQITPQAGRELETRPGGPVPVFSRLVERFKPETFYVSPARRTLFMVCDLSPTDTAELMLAGDRIAGQHPDFIPVLPGKEFGALIAQALPGANKLVDG